MQLSENYRAFEKMTMIVVINSQRARFIKAEGRDLNEVNELERGERENEGRPGLGPNAGPLDEDAQEKEDVKRFFKEVAEYLQKKLPADVENLIIAVPDFHMNLLEENLHPDTKAKILEMVNKNLASLEVSAIAKIILE